MRKTSSIRSTDFFVTGRILETTSLISLCLLLIIATFPVWEPVHGLGIDASLSWAYNYMFEVDRQSLSHLSFPHGPWAFIGYPLGFARWHFFVFHVLVRLALFTAISKGLQAHLESRQWRIVVTFLVCYGLCLSQGIFYLLLIALTIFFIVSLRANQRAWRFLGYGIFLVCIMFRSYPAIMAGLITAAFLTISTIKYKKLRSVGIEILGLALAYLILWLLTFGDTSGVINHFTSLAYLSLGNSAAVSLYPENSWLLILGGWAGITVLFILGKGQEFKWMKIMLALPLYAAWKHGIAREDIHHVGAFLSFLVMFFLLCLLLSERRRPLMLGVGILTLIIFDLNFSGLGGHRPAVYRNNGLSNFISFFDSNVQREFDQDQERVYSKAKLPDSLRQLIGNQSIDIYPHRLALAPANNLNWVPRPVLQSYAAYNAWLVNRNVKHFESKKAPKCILWHKSLGANGHYFSSIDQRSAIQDEPDLFKLFLTDYNIIYEDRWYALFKRRDESRRWTIKESSAQSVYWNTWTDIQNEEGDIVELQVDLKSRLSDRFKAFFFKEDPLYLQLRAHDGVVHTNRVVPSSLVSGLHVSPHFSKTISGSGHQIKAFKLIHNARSASDLFDAVLNRLSLEEDRRQSVPQKNGLNQCDPVQMEVQLEAEDSKVQIDGVRLSPIAVWKYRPANVLSDSVCITVSTQYVSDAPVTDKLVLGLRVIYRDDTIQEDYYAPFKQFTQAHLGNLTVSKSITVKNGKQLDRIESFVWNPENDYFSYAPIAVCIYSYYKE